MQKKTERQPRLDSDKPKRAFDSKNKESRQGKSSLSEGKHGKLSRSENKQSKTPRSGSKLSRSRPAAEEKRRGQRSIVKSASTLLPYITEMLSERSKSAVKSILKHGQVFVNGKSMTHFDTPLNAGDEVLISHEKGQIEFNHPLLKIVWEDDELIVVDKGEGLLSVSDSPTQERTAYFLLTKYVKKINPRNRIFILHRLDKGTSGLMMFAKNREIQEYLRANWHRMITRRTYVAMIEGVPEKKEDTIVTYLAENSRMKVYCTDPENGKEAISHYNVVKSNTQYSLLEIELETGRKNQIRAQMEYIGHPVAGDPKYSAQTDPAKRLMLHAQRLFFIHPATGMEMRFETRIPKIFNLK